MEFNGLQNIETQKIIITERSYNFKNLLSYFENISSTSKISTPFIVEKDKPKVIEQKIIVNKKQKRVSFDLSKNTTFLYESEESMEKRIKNDVTEKENRTIVKQLIMASIRLENYPEQENKMYNYKEIRHFWENGCKKKINK